MKKAHGRIAAGLVAAAMLFAASACGSDSNSSAQPGTTTGGSSGGDADCSIDRPVQFIGLAEKRGDSPSAIDDSDEGWSMAVEEINAAGGVCGQPIEYTRISTSATDGAAAKNSFLQALDKNPDFVSGPTTSPAMLGIAPDVSTAGVPVVYQATADDTLVGGKLGSEWGFTQRPNATTIATAVAEYVVQEGDKSKIGLVCVDTAFGKDSCDAAEAKIEDLGAEVVARETSAPAATDLTAQVVALKSSGADSVMSFNYPAPTVLLYNQSADNNFNVPIYGFSGAAFAMASGAIKESAIPNVWATDDCAPAGDPDSKEFADAYQAKFGKPLKGSGYLVAEAYDSVYIAAQAIESGGSLDPESIAEALRTETFDGVCDSYKSGVAQDMNHGSVMMTFGKDGIPVIEAQLTLPDA